MLDRFGCQVAVSNDVIVLIVSESDFLLLLLLLERVHYGVLTPEPSEFAF